jgi:hypothetical protein
MCICTTVQAEEVCDSLHGVVYKFAVNHKKELTHFNVYPPLDCNKKESEKTLTKAWLKTACGYFLSTKPKKTYGRWGKPKYEYGFYSYDSKHPEIIILPWIDNKPANPDHVVVLKSILNDNSKDDHVCNGELLIPYEN